ncbi:MAG: Ig-like domain-containing protein [Bacteroidaceae bacterium]|nr:Ig-like domain-containing protein [Bacteroidaceae bacterium]
MKKKDKILFLVISTFMVGLMSCANMGSPEGGLYDETPPRVLSTHPMDKSTNVNTKNIAIHFDEYINIENATEKVVVSPPQAEMPEIKTRSKDIVVILKDSLKKNTTYTVDFSDAIVDFHENNPMGNYTYSFSTGSEIDTFEVSGQVLNAANLEPIKGILVGLYRDLSDTAFVTKPMDRVSRTDSRGHFVIKGVGQGKYRVYALQDMDGDYRYSQKSEMLAFSHDTITASTMQAIRQDTLWRDSLHIDSIKLVPYTRFMPDNLVLLAFNETMTDRHLIKSERMSENKFALYFSFGHEQLPVIKGLNFDADDKLLAEASEKKDTIIYWIKDSLLINRDTLLVEAQYFETDTTGVLVNKIDTLELIPKLSFEKRQKLFEEEYKEWEKQQNKNRKKGLPYDSIMPPKPLAIKYQTNNTIAPDGIYTIDVPTPLKECNADMIHLYVQVDSMWYSSPFEIRRENEFGHQYNIIAEWREGCTYSLEIDSMAFVDIYGLKSSPFKTGIRIGKSDEYSSLIISVYGGGDKDMYVMLIDKSEKELKISKVQDGHAEFYYLKPGNCYLKLFVDDNGNGVWDTGEYALDKQAEKVYYYNKEVECKEKWDVSIDWNLNALSTERQKPSVLIQQKGDKEKTIRYRNYDYMQQHKRQYAKQLNTYKNFVR